MNKLFIIISVVLAMAIISPAYAFFGSTTYNYDIENKGGKGGDAEANAKATGVGVGIGVGYADVDNEIDADFHNCNKNINKNENNNKNTNLNLQDQKQDQDQAQGQLQGQMQGQAQSATAVNKGNKQTMIYNEAKNPVAFGHIDSGVGKTDADLKDTVSSDIRMFSSIFAYDDDSFITSDEAKAMAGGSVKVIKSVMREADVQLKELNWKETSGVYMGSLMLTTDSATLDQMVAKACVEAMKLGATSVKFKVGEREVAGGSKKGFDLGTSASIALNPDTGSAMIAPGATLGYSSAKAWNTIVPELFVVMFHDVSLIVE